MSDTIYALATAQGRAAVAIVRVSGPLAGFAIQNLCGRSQPARNAVLRRLRSAEGEVIDHALVLWLPGPASYTGEDSAEFHVHGGQAVIAALLEALGALGLRLADPGEFTRRAFENGRLDLAQAEGVADLIDAETQAQRLQAIRQLDGVLGRAQQAWRADLTECLAVLEAAIDFPDEDVPADVADRAKPVLMKLISQLKAAAVGIKRAEQVRDGFKIALIGAPNAGKSTLLNALSRREAAIVTATPGTTRDIIEVGLKLGGYKVIIADTAGLRDTGDEIEAEGVRRAKAWAAQADLRAWIVDGAAEHNAGSMPDLVAGDLCVINKADLVVGGETGAALTLAQAMELEVHRISARKTADIEALEGALSQRVVSALSATDPPTATRLRHGALLDEALIRLQSAHALRDAPELAAEDVRLAVRALDRITGRIHPEDVLDRVFASFCIGK